jgi:hypothetical protein
LPDKKKQHYIPKFYLKRFSINNEERTIGLYNLSNEKFITNASIPNQGYKNYFYGKDGEIEGALEKMENQVSRLFNYWTKEKLLYPPPIHTNGYKLLKRFILCQAYRVPKSGESYTKSINEALTVFLKEFKPDLANKLKDYKVELEEPVLLMLFNALKHEHFLNFMDCRFLVNLSPIPFFTSDAPVIFYNQLMEKANSYMGATGLVTKGLQIFYPIHPRLMICLYDPEVYDFGKGSKDCIGAESVAEIHQLNGLQLINSDTQLFFNETISKAYILSLLSHFRSYRETGKNINKAFKIGNRKFLYMSSVDACIDLELDCFSLKVNPKEFKGQIVPLRHPSLK